MAASKRILVALTALSCGAAVLGVAQVILRAPSIRTSGLVFAKVERGPFIRSFLADGNVVAGSSPVVYSPAAGVVSLNVNVGDLVEKGQAIAEMEADDLKTQFALAQAAFRRATLALEQAKQEAIDRLRQEQLEYHKAEVDLAAAERNFRRSKGAFESGAYSELQMLNAEDNLVKAKFMMTTAEEKLSSAHKVTAIVTATKEAELQEATLYREDAQRRIDQLTIRSPIAGRIGQILVRDAATVAKGAQLLNIVDVGNFEIEVPVPEYLVREVVTGTPALMKRANGTEFRAIVKAVSPEVVDRQVAVRFYPDQGAPEDLRQNERVTANVVLDRNENALTISAGSAIGANISREVFVVDGRVARRTMAKFGPTSVDRVEVISGLREGDVVVITGEQALGNQQTVLLDE